MQLDCPIPKVTAVEIARTIPKFFPLSTPPGRIFPAAPPYRGDVPPAPVFPRQTA